jgi:hypothetical protein
MSRTTRSAGLPSAAERPTKRRCGLRGAARLAETLAANRSDAELFRTLATLVTDLDVGRVDDWRWTGPTDDLAAWADRLDAPDVVRNVGRLQVQPG